MAGKSLPLGVSFIALLPYHHQGLRMNQLHCRSAQRMGIVRCCLSLAIGFGFAVAALAREPDAVINLWPDKPPGEPLKVAEEQDFTKPTDRLIAGRRIIKLGNVKNPQAH